MSLAHLSARPGVSPLARAGSGVGAVPARRGVPTTTGIPRCSDRMCRPRYRRQVSHADPPALPPLTCSAHAHQPNQLTAPCRRRRHCQPRRRSGRHLRRAWPWPRSRRPCRCPLGSRGTRSPGSRRVAIAVDETVILLQHPLLLLGASIVIERERHQNDSLVNG